VRAGFLPPRTDMMYIARGVAGVLAMPLLCALLIGASAGVLHVCGRKRAAKWAMVAALAVAYGGSTAILGDALLRPLERVYAPLREDQAMPAVGYIVVLGSDYSPRDGISVTAALDGDALVRIVEGVRLFRKMGGAHLVVSGGAPMASAAPALGYARLARDLGIEEGSLIVMDHALDTRAEARDVQMLLGKSPFILVTSAYHMPRAVRLMTGAGAQPVPAPTGQLANSWARENWRGLLPSSNGLRKTERAMHEYLGLAALLAGIS
jgi:uncharacterized SAM-binding protein YcdF (DUF218 family)